MNKDQFTFSGHSLMDYELLLHFHLYSTHLPLPLFFILRAISSVRLSPILYQLITSRTPADFLDLAKIQASFSRFRLEQEFSPEQMIRDREKSMSMLTFRWYMMKISRWRKHRKYLIISIYASKRIHLLARIKFNIRMLIQFHVL